MQIRNIRVDRFGACSNLSLDSFTEGINVIHGPAGSGKATIGRFIRSILYGFDDSTRRQYLPVHSRGYGGTLSIRTHSGEQTITRVDDGSHDGRLTIEREDGSVLQRRQIPDTIAAVRESTFDRVYAVDYRRRPGIGALIEEANTCGLDLVGRSADFEQLSTLERQLRQQRDCLATVPRVDATRDELSIRRDSLLQEISELEATLSNQPDEASLASELEGLESQRDQWQAELRILQKELDAAEHRRQQIPAGRESEPIHGADLPQLRTYDELVSQIERWQNTLREITSQRQSLEEKAVQLASSELPGDPRGCLGEIESRLDHVQSTLADLDNSANYQGREIQTLLTDVVAELRANVYRLCNELNKWEAAARHHHLSGEARDLMRCESELRLAIRSATGRQVSLQHEIETAFGGDAELLAPWNGAHCQCAEHPSLRAQLPRTPNQSGGDDERSIAMSEIASLERRQNRLTADLDEIESEVEDARAQLVRLDRVELLDQLDAKRVELRHVDQRLRDLDRRRKLLAEIATTEEAIAEVRSNAQTPTLGSKASEYLHRLTAGDLRTIEVAVNEQVWVVDEHGRRRAYHQLSDGGRDLVYLSICLALVESFQARAIHVPMIVSGALTHVDSKNVPEAAELLRDFAAKGHQILLFTRHEHVASVFRLLNIPVHTLDVVAPPSANTKRGEGSPFAPTSSGAVTEHDHDPRDAFTLSEHSPIEDAPAIDAISAARLRTIGVMRVGDLLRLSAKSAASELREYGTTVAQIVSWQAQSRLLCEVPRLRGYDARILVACGITEPEQLYRLSPSELRKIVKDMAASSNGQTLLLSGTEFELSRVADWIGIQHMRSGIHRDGESSSSHRHSTRNPDVVRMHPTDSQWKFYLDRDNSVVDAPSIGARTAERLRAVHIETVSDLLNADPESLSKELGVKRFTAKVVAQWQQQAELACRVPQLRGHDAQILVALGVTDAETLAASDPQELWSSVEPFIETKEGKRIIRNGKTPDLDEVTEWVQWAQASRRSSAA